MWGMYKNGNAVTRINMDDGTKIRSTEDDFWDLEFPETIDISCTSYCDGGCPFCYANCTTSGVHADLMGVEFIDTLMPYTEAALQLNDLSHPQIIPFLEKLRDMRVIANITVNQKHFERHEDLLWGLSTDGLVHGIGISLVNPTDEFILSALKFQNAVIHTINGILTESDVEKMSGVGLKLLILGYKNIGRGLSYTSNHQDAVETNQNWLKENITNLFDHFDVVSFDNLAIAQLGIQDVLSDDEWARFYMGDEGTSSMYVDLVNQKFGVSSLCSQSEMFPIMDNIRDMFKIVKTAAAGHDSACLANIYR